MMLKAKMEALLFAAGRPLTQQELTVLCQIDREKVQEALSQLSRMLEEQKSGLCVVWNDKEAELVTHPDASTLVRALFHEEVQGELSKPSLETLTILAYRGPMTRPEIEQIRGVQCSLVLRHLQMRGLVEQREELKFGLPIFDVTLDFLKYLGVERREDLPDYEHLRNHQNLVRVLESSLT